MHTHSHTTHPYTLCYIYCVYVSEYNLMYKHLSRLCDFNERDYHDLDDLMCL